MKMKNIVQPDVVAVAVTAMLSIYGGVTCTTTPTPTGTQATVTITGNTAFTGIGQTAQLTVTATFSNGTSQTLAAHATWQSTNPAVATVSPSGLVTAVGVGQAVVQATLPPSAAYQGTTWTIQVTVTSSLAGARVR
jgi:trimeric autotransporter adhesin